MDDDFEVYAEDNLESILKNLPQKLTKWETFEDEEAAESLDVEFEKDGFTEKLTTLKYSKHTEEIKKNSQIMIIRHKKSGDSDELKQILRGLHETKLENTTIEELDLLDVFVEHYDNFHIEYEDKDPNDEIFKRPTYSDSDEEEEREINPEEDNNDEETEGDIQLDFKTMLEMRNMLKNMDHDDPLRLDAAEKLVNMISRNLDK